jgi:hypothetical protein
MEDSASHPDAPIGLQGAEFAPSPRRRRRGEARIADALWSGA